MSYQNLPSPPWPGAAPAASTTATAPVRAAGRSEIAMSVVMKIERTARQTHGCTRYGSVGKMVVMYGSTPSGWFERYFDSVEKALKHAERKGWAVEAGDASIGASSTETPEWRRS
jgi:hypothetical protein